jgi:hypothetical protein
VRERNEVWDSLEVILGYKPRTKTEKTAFAKVVRSLEDAEATPQEMKDAAAQYQKCWPHCELTLWSFEKWFGHFLSKATKRSTATATVCPECGVNEKVGHAGDCSRAT